LVYLSPDGQVMSVAMSDDRGAPPSVPRPLFDGRLLPSAQYDQIRVSRDCSRILLKRPAGLLSGGNTPEPLGWDLVKARVTDGWPNGQVYAALGQGVTGLLTGQKSIDDVLNRLAPLLAKHRLCVLPRVRWTMRRLV